jgi:phosphoenolpyruvate carboxylase
LHGGDEPSADMDAAEEHSLDDLLALTERARARAGEDPFGNPVLAIALAVTRLTDDGELPLSRIAALIRHLRDDAFAARARRLAAYVGGTDTDAVRATMAGLAARLVRPDPDDSPVPWRTFRDSIERAHFSAVFTAHPTFALPAPVFAALADAACGRPGDTCFVSHRPDRPTLAQEFDAAAGAIAHGRDALDALCRILLDAARSTWPDRWSTACPRPITLASWVGYDTDGRTDIGWWDTLRLRLTMKRLQLARVHGQVAALPGSTALADRLTRALQATDAQIAACPANADAAQTQRFAALLADGHEAALTSVAPLLALFETAMLGRTDQDSTDTIRMDYAVARAGLAAHGLALAHTHVRLNASQLHNAVRLRLGLDSTPEDRARRRTGLAAINTALDAVTPVAVDFGALLAEQASAARLLMTVAQIVKHIDGGSPVRFLIAETESGYTLLCALWLARLFGVDRHVEISPLFETADALEHGARILEEALRSPHYRAYLKRTGRLCLQFGYSDSGRYVGQLAASYLIERLRLKVAESMQRHGLTDIELVLFDTHGESIGRGAHPGSLLDRLRYLSPSVARQAFAAAGITTRDEAAFQGGDGYLLFGTPELALATIGRIAKHAFAAVPKSTDPIYGGARFRRRLLRPDPRRDAELVDDPGYASAARRVRARPCSIRTGSRPSGAAIGWHRRPGSHPPSFASFAPSRTTRSCISSDGCANTLHGHRRRRPAQSGFNSPTCAGAEPALRPRHAMFADARAACTPTSACCAPCVAIRSIQGRGCTAPAHARRPGRARGTAGEIARRAGEARAVGFRRSAMFRRLQADHLSLREAWPAAPRMQAAEVLLHALRVALIGRVWLLAMAIPEFSPRHGVTREALVERLLRLDVPAALVILAEVFPAAADPAVDRDFSEPRGDRASVSYRREHEGIFQPLGEVFSLLREIGTAVTHHVGAYG